MDTEEFRVRGKEMVDYICDYMDGLSSRRVTPNVEPGYLRELIPSQAPQHPENWDTIMTDVDTKIMPGVSKEFSCVANTSITLVGKPEGRRPFGRPRRRWEDNIKMDLREVGWGDMD
jgi:hypothetical protein